MILIVFKYFFQSNGMEPVKKKQRKLVCIYCNMKNGGSGLILKFCKHAYHAGCFVYKIKQDLKTKVSTFTCVECSSPIHWRELKAAWTVLYHPHSQSRTIMTPEENDRKIRLEEEIEKIRFREHWILLLLFFRLYSLCYPLEMLITSIFNSIGSAG